MLTDLLLGLEAAVALFVGIVCVLLAAEAIVQSFGPKR